MNADKAIIKMEKALGHKLSASLLHQIEKEWGVQQHDPDGSVSAHQDLDGRIYHTSVGQGNWPEIYPNQPMP